MSARTRAWLLLIVGPLAWSLVELVGYPLAAHACAGPTPDLARSEPSGVLQGLLFALIGAALVATTWAFVAALRHRRAQPVPPPRAEETGRFQAASRGRTSFLAFTGMVLNGVSLAGIVFYALGALLVEPCSRIS